jgi:hypothetical protein
MKKKTRAYQAVEIYRNIYHTKINTEAMRRRYGVLNEEAAEVEYCTAEAEQDVEQLEEAEAKNKAIKEDERALEHIRGHCQARMVILRKAALELYAAESAEVKAEIEKETAEWNTARAGAEVDDGERSPQQFQK